jgi:mRNA interferase MazF
MLNMTDCKFGDIVLLPFPFTDQTGTERRPAVIVSSPAYHRFRGDLVVMAVTSRLTSDAVGVGGALIRTWREAGLLKPSQFKPVLATIAGDLVLRKMGELGAEDLASLRGLLAAVLGGPVCAWPIRLLVGLGFDQCQSRPDLTASAMRTFNMVVERDLETRLYFGYVPGWPGAHSQGATLDELEDNLREPIEMLLEEMEPEFESEFIGVQTLSVA